MITLVLGALAEEPRPILGIGVGIRGDGDGADFVASARVRTSERLVLEPGLLLGYDADTWTLDYPDDSGADDSRQAERDVWLLPSLGLRGRLGQRGRASGWLVAQLSGSYRDVELEFASWPAGEESGKNDDVIVATERHVLLSGGGGFASEVFVSPEIAVSADLGAQVVSAGWVSSVNATNVTTGTSTGTSEADSFSDYSGFSLGFEPYAQLAVHLYY